MRVWKYGQEAHDRSLARWRVYRDDVGDIIVLDEEVAKFIVDAANLLEEITDERCSRAILLQRYEAMLDSRLRKAVVPTP